MKKEELPIWQELIRNASYQELCDLDDSDFFIHKMAMVEIKKRELNAKLWGFSLDHSTS